MRELCQRPELCNYCNKCTLLKYNYNIMRAGLKRGTLEYRNTTFLSISNNLTSFLPTDKEIITILALFLFLSTFLLAIKLSELQPNLSLLKELFKKLIVDEMLKE